MATIHLIGGEKGGVGKSLLARILAQYFIDHRFTCSRLRCRSLAWDAAALLCQLYIADRRSMTIKVSIV